MAITNHERVGRALSLLASGLYPYVEREMKAVYGDRWTEAAIGVLPDFQKNKASEEVLKQDVSALLTVMWERWHEIFKKTLGKSERTLVSELKETRNTWAHTTSFSADDAYRALDSVERLLNAISAPEASQVGIHKQELLRLKYEEQTRNQTRRFAMSPIEGEPPPGLKPWREIVAPHPDVASGNFQQAEFAADLWQVYLGQASEEYQDPIEFYRRTFLTEGLRQLLTNALKRLSGQGGDPVIELQTNFGGGKTHAMLALYHFFASPLSSHGRGAEGEGLILPGTEPIFQATGIQQPPPNVKIAVLVGNKLQPSGIVPYGPDAAQRPAIKTLWGELAWQLGGPEGYAMVRSADETSTNPGDTLTHLFNRYSPCLILIDEWVAYARQLHEDPSLAGGSFDTQFTFAQTLSESAKNARQTLLVVSVPASDIEIGGERGKDALIRLKNALGRVESPWRPASPEESFEIVRRRLFETITDPQLFTQRDAVVRAFMDLYRKHSQDFPSECTESSYERRLKAAYPIHPELFDRLYSDWSSLDQFQRTRGVLRLMARVIHTLWERNDRSLMILPAHVPMDDQQVQAELTRYLEDHWVPVIDKDVDGANSVPLALDRENPTFGRYSACRRVARTIYLGSAPTLKAANRGIEERRIKLGCVQPGEIVSTFSDALRRLSDRGTYLYVDGSRYWVSTQPNVNRTAQERAEQLLSERLGVWQEIIRRLKADKNRGEFKAVHVVPDTSGDIPDDSRLGVRLVILHPRDPHTKNSQDSPARTWAEQTLRRRGSGPRYYQNTLLFLAADKAKLENLERNTAQYLAWKSIVEEKELLNLDAFQSKQAQTKLDQSADAVEASLRETYQWLLVPTQPEPQGRWEWKETRLQGQESPILQASRKAVQEQDLLRECSANFLRLDVLDRFLWPDRNHVELTWLWECLARYLYLPRLKDLSVLLEAVKKEVGSPTWDDYFAYAEGFDEAKNQYLGLRAGSSPSLDPDLQGLLVKPEVARLQLEAPPVAPVLRENRPEGERPPYRVSDTGQSQPDLKKIPSPPQRFYGRVEIDPLRVNRDIPTIAAEVIQHLTALSGAQVRITLEIEADLPAGAPEHVVRTVTENCRTLKFSAQAFEANP